MAFVPGQRGHALGLDAPHELLRHLEGLSGSVEMEMELAPRPEYGLTTPLFRRTENGGRRFGGPNRVIIAAGVEAEIAEATMRERFRLTEGEGAGFALRWLPAHPHAMHRGIHHPVQARRRRGDGIIPCPPLRIPRSAAQAWRWGYPLPTPFLVPESQHLSDSRGSH
jgi:hypothetical protein